MTTPTQPDTHVTEQIAELHERLAEAEGTLRAIRSGDVDAIRVSTPAGELVYSLKDAESPYRAMIEAMNEGAVSITADGMVLYCNRAFARLTGIDPHTIMGSSLLAYFADRDKESIARTLEECRDGDCRVRASLRTVEGALLPVNVAMHALANDEIPSVIIVTSDLTQITAAQDAATRINRNLEHANRSLRMLNACNTTIIRATDEQQLLADTCRILVDVGGYLMGWIGYVEHDDAKSVRPVAWADGDGSYIEAIRASWGDNERGRGPCGRAIRDGRTVVMRDATTDPTFAPWRELAQHEGLRSMAVMPLWDGNGIFGVLVVYSGQPDAFDEKEQNLLTELAGDIAYCINNLRRETKLAETRGFLDNILQSSTKYSIISEDLDRKILYWNEGARRNYGYTADEVIGKPIYILATPEDLASGTLDRLAATAMATGVAEIELQRVRKDGTQFPANVVMTRRGDASGKPIGYLVISSDISEKRQAEESLRAASKYARSLIEASLDPMVTISPDGKITDVNHGTELITGRRREHLIGTDFATYFTEPERARSGSRKVYANGFLIDYPLAIRHVAGTVTEVSCNASLYYEADGSVGGVFLAARDVSRLSTPGAGPETGHRWGFWRYLGSAIAAIVTFIAVAQTSLYVQDWLHRQQDLAGLGRTMATHARMQSLLLKVTPSAARVRVATLQRQPGTGVALSYIGTYAIASADHNPGPIASVAPITAFANVLPELVVGRCVHLTRQIINQAPERSDVVLCPILGNDHWPIGLLAMSWDKGDPVPANFDAAMAAAKQASVDIAAIWDHNRE